MSRPSLGVPASSPAVPALLTFVWIPTLTAQVDAVFEPFAGLNALHHSLFSQPAWVAATAAFKETMLPIERIVARNLSSRLASSGLKGHALLREFVRYKVHRAHNRTAALTSHASFRNAPLLTHVASLQELVRRDLVFKELAPARETLVGQLEQQLERLREDFETRTSEGGVDRVAAGLAEPPSTPRAPNSARTCPKW